MESEREKSYKGEKIRVKKLKERDKQRVCKWRQTCRAARERVGNTQYLEYVSRNILRLWASQ